MKKGAKLILSSTMVGKPSMAMINNRVVRKGEIIEGFLLEKVFIDNVVLKKDDLILELKIRENNYKYQAYDNFNYYNHTNGEKYVKSHRRNIKRNNILKENVASDMSNKVSGTTFHNYSNMNGNFTPGTSRNIGGTTFHNYSDMNGNFTSGTSRKIGSTTFHNFSD